MVRDCSDLSNTRFVRFQFAFFEQLTNKRCVVNHIVVAAKLRVLVLDRVEAVWACRDDLLDVIPLERFHIRFSLHLE